VRAEALEQAESLGAKALRIDLGQTGGTDQGYAKELTPEQLEKQRLEQGKVCAQSDVVITTAKVFGRKPPILIKKDVVEGMQPGSIIVDLAAETGGNVEGIVPGEETVTANGVRLIGLANYEGQVSKHASQVLAANFANMIEHFWDKEAKTIRINPVRRHPEGLRDHPRRRRGPRTLQKLRLIPFPESFARMENIDPLLHLSSLSWRPFWASS
jgi:H+-translocating NAD(P) transhydrogenase subunit alpha